MFPFFTQKISRLGWKLAILMKRSIEFSSSCQGLHFFFFNSATINIGSHLLNDKVPEICSLAHSENITNNGK